MIPDRDPDVLLARIDRLERRLAGITRLLMGTGVLVLIVVVALVASHRDVVSAQGRGTPGELIATSLKLVDASGKPRAAFYVDGKTAGLALSDPAGRTRVLLNTDGESSKLAIVGADKGFPRIVLSQLGDTQMLNMENANAGQSFISLLHSPDTPMITLASKSNSAEIGVGEVLARGARPTLAPKVVLTQGDRTVAALPAAASAR